MVVPTKLANNTRTFELLATSAVAVDVLDDIQDLNFNASKHSVVTALNILFAVGFRLKIGRSVLI